MATTTSKPGAPSPPTGRPPGSGSSHGRERPMGGLELWTWLFMRISGLVLLVLAVGHVLIMHLPGGGVSRIDFGFVAARWDNPVWQTWDWMLLILALVHGVSGLRTITMDYVRKPGLRFAITTLFILIGFVMMVLGTVIIFTFDPAKWGVTG